MTLRLANIIIACLFFVGLPLTVWAHSALSALTAPAAPPSSPKRVVTLAPSVTETIFALGQGDRVVGVTQYCRYPAEAALLPKVAGFTDVNYEAVLRLKPDLVVLPVDKKANKEELERLGLTVMTLDTRNLTGYMESILALGEATSSLPLAEEVVAKLKNSIDGAERRAEGLPRPRVLFSVMHSYQGFGYITEITAVGQDGFFSQMLEMAGGTNVYQGPLSFPKLSREAILTVNPDVVIDLIQGSEQADLALNDWLGLGRVKAVETKRIYLFSDESDTVPGPRIHLTLDKLSLALHPNAAAKDAADSEAFGPPDSRTADL
ncbi:MAG: ABC transporter substrate-binding protein [Deltaproteobacteria bacterium]|jgi:iron complex transport system substrate-binding protein|nr:ABC transporter substrate-binding protein [Deltaproteobacteria bacterium]